MTWGRSMAVALRSTLMRPRWWAIALAAFLLRGGLVAVVIPAVVLPTVASISIVAAPFVSDLVLGGSAAATAVILAVLVGVATWLVVSGLVGAWLDVALHEEAATLIGGGTAGMTRARPLRRVLSARISSHGLTALALGFATVRIVGAAYDELTSPSDPALPVVARVILAAPDAVILLVLAWMLAEAVGGIALRRFVAPTATEVTVASAIGHGIRDLLRPRGLATLVVTNLAVVALAVPLWLAAGAAFDHLRTLFSDGASVPELGIGLVLLVLAWATGLALLGVGLAWRAAAWTAESLPRAAGPPAVEPTPIEA